jgi:GR25 family glycosyltransferase involved in LPS biosynthesis
MQNVLTGILLAVVATTVICIFTVVPSLFLSVDSPQSKNIPVGGRSFVCLTSSSLLHVNTSVDNTTGIDNVYVINLPRRVDRRITSIALVQTLQLNAIFVRAFDSHSIEVQSRLHWTELTRMTVPEIACWASHMQIWFDLSGCDQSSSPRDKWTLILEDDVDLEMSTSEILRSFPTNLWSNFDMIYLGHCGNAPGQFLYHGRNGYQVHQATNPSCTHAYVIRTSTARQLVKLLASPNAAVDDEIVRLAKQGKLNIASIHPPVAIQRLFNTTQPSDVNPVLTTCRYKLRRTINRVIEWLRGVQQVHDLVNSTLVQADLDRANRWRLVHETSVWKQ